jgi:Domain of unknown function (DUF4430)
VLARSAAVWVSAAALAALLVPDALAVKVHMRVEGKNRTIFGSTAPLIDVTSPRANPLPESALDALESASVLGEFYYHVTGAPTVRVDQIGRIAEFGQTVWTFKVNGVAPPVGAAEYRLQPGDSVVWYWAQFGFAGGPKTLLLRRRGRCYTVLQQDDRGGTAAATGAVLRIGSRRTVTTANGRACISPHRGLLVRATLAGAIRSNALP